MPYGKAEIQEFPLNQPSFQADITDEKHFIWAKKTLLHLTNITSPKEKVRVLQGSSK